MFLSSKGNSLWEGRGSRCGLLEMGGEPGRNDSTLMRSQGLVDYLRNLDLAQRQWKAIKRLYTEGWHDWINILGRSLKLQYGKLKKRR